MVQVPKIVEKLRGDNVRTYRELEMTRKHGKCSDKAEGLYQKGREKGNRETERKKRGRNKCC